MIKNTFFLFCMTFGLLTMQGCIKKKETASNAVQKQAAKNKAAKTKGAKTKGAAGAKLTPAQAARRKAAANTKNKKNKKANGTGKPAGYWPSLRKHLGIDFAKLQKIKGNESKRMADLSKAGAKAVTVNGKYDAEAKKILGPALFAKMQSFSMK